MEKKIKIYYDSKGDSLHIWFDDPKKEVFCEETGEEITLCKDKLGKVIGFEKLNFALNKIKHSKQILKSLPIELVMR